MAGEGALVTAAVTLVACAAFGHVAVRVLRDPPALSPAPAQLRAEGLLFLLIAATLLPTGLQQLVGYAGMWPHLETALYQALHVPVALSMVVLMHVTAKRLAGHRIVAMAAAALYALLGVIGIVALYVAGAQAGSHEVVSMVLAFLALPAMTATGLLVLAALQVGGVQARRIRMASLSAAVFYTAFTMDAVGASGFGLFAVRCVMVGAAVLAYGAYFPLRAMNGPPPAFGHVMDE